MSFEKFNTLRTSYEEAILVVTLTRPEVRNAMNGEMMQELYTLWRKLYRPKEDIRCIILIGEGDKAFCAGADLKERDRIDLETWRQHHAMLQQAMLSMADCPIPIIAAVNGCAYGGGLELALGADLCYATQQATFCQSEARLGIMPGAGGTQSLARLCGVRRAKELSYTGRVFTAVEAHQWGLVNALYSEEELFPAVKETALAIARNAPLAVRQIKRAIYMAQSVDLKSGYLYEIAAYDTLLETEDRKEGIQAFNQKRRPFFRGK